MPPGLIPGVRSIVVLRANALGDLLFTLPALEALRVAYPAAEITLLAQDRFRAFLESRPLPVDRIVGLPFPFVGDEGAGAPDPAVREGVLARLRAERFDIALQLHGGGRNSNPIVRALRARVTAGSTTPDAEPLDRSIEYVYWQHEIHRYLELVGLVGATPVTLEPRLPTTPAERAAAERVLGPLDEPPLAVLHPGATDPRRRWPPASFAAVGDVLAERGLRVVVTGTGEERGLADEVLGTMSAAAVSLVDRLDLGALSGVLAASRIVVSNDSGPLHLAAAVGAPTVGIYWCGNLVNASQPYRARHRPAVSWRINCPACGASCLDVDCGHRISFVGDVPPRLVIDAALGLLAEASEIALRTVAPSPAA